MSGRALLICLSAIALTFAAGFFFTGERLDAWFGDSSPSDHTQADAKLAGAFNSQDGRASSSFNGRNSARDLASADQGDATGHAHGHARRHARSSKGRGARANQRSGTASAGASGHADGAGEDSAEGDEAADADPDANPDEAEESEADAEAAADDQAGKALTITGSVQDDAGQPVTEALVTLESESRTTSVKTDAGGNFKIANLLTGEQLTLRASKSGYTADGSAMLTKKLDQAGVQAAGTLKLQRAMTVSGRIVQADGAPAAAARVQLFQRRDGGRFSSVSSKVTGGGGSFLFDRLGSGEYRLEIEHAGHSTKFENNVRPPQELEIKLENASAIEGRVLDEVGQPVPNASVTCELRSEPDLHFQSRVRTESDGSFKVECPPGSVHNTLKVSATGFSTQTLPLVAAGKKLDIKLVPNENAVVRGTVAFLDGAYPASMRVQVSALRDGKRTNAQDDFAFSGQSPARFELEFLPLEGGIHTLKITGDSFKPLTMQLGDVRKREVLELGEILVEGGLKLAGVVKIGEAKGKPAAGARITLPSGVSENADGAGKFTLSGVEKNTQVLLTFKLDGYPIGRQEISVGEQDIKNLVLVIPYGDRQLSGVVLSAADKSPIPGASVKILNEGAPAVQTNAEGEFFISNALQSEVKLRVSHPEFAGKDVSAITYSKDEAISEGVRVELVPGSSIYGSLTKAIGGGPVRHDAEVVIYRGAAIAARAKTDTDGNYASQPLEEGTYFVAVPEFHLPPIKVVNPGKAGIKHDRVVRGTISVSGRVTLSNGAPHSSAGIYVYWYKQAGVFSTIYTNSNGEFEIENLWPGTFSLAILKHPSDQAAQWVQEITVSEGVEEQHFNVQLPPSNALIEGRVTYPNGDPVSGARVSITNKGYKMARGVLSAYTVTDADGFFRATRMQEHASFEVRVGGYYDNATTGISFAEDITTGNAGSVRAVNLVAAERGYNIRVPSVRADGGPLMREVTGILFDEQGRRSGNFFGNTLDLIDVVPGRYELVAYSAGMVAARVTLVVNDGGSYALVGAERLEFVVDPEYG